MKSGGKSGARFDILADLEEDLDGIGNPVFSGLEGKQGVVDGAGKDSSIDKETVDRKFQGQAAIQGKNRGIDFNQGRSKVSSGSIIRSSPSSFNCDQPKPNVEGSSLPLSSNSPSIRTRPISQNAKSNISTRPNNGVEPAHEMSAADHVGNF